MPGTSGGDPAPADIADVPAFLRTLGPGDLQRFAAIYEVREEIGVCPIPPAMEGRVGQWFSRPGEALPAVLSRVAQQPVLAVFNHRTCEEARFNTLRMSRPQTRQADAGVLAEATLEELYAATDCPEKCDFCAWEERTVADAWGRVVSPLGCATAANVGKVGALHGMVLLPVHHPVRPLVDPSSGPALLRDVLATAREWCRRAIRHAAADQSPPPGAAWHALLFWNVGLGSGASQPHGHVQLLACPGHAPGRAEIQRRAAMAHRTETGRDYLEDVLWCHRLLGLAVPVVAPPIAASPGRAAEATAGAFVVVPLTPASSHELWALGRTLDDVADALHVASRVLREHFRARCFNVGCLLPTGIDDSDDSSGWILARVMDRTSQPSARGNVYGTGIGAGEVYGPTVEDCDLYATREAVAHIAAQIPPR